MSDYIRASRFLVSLLVSFLVWAELTSFRTEVGQAAEESFAASRSLQVSSRGGARPVSTGTLGHDTLAVRAQFALPAPAATVAPLEKTPTPVPQPELKYLGVFTVTGYSDSPRNGTDGRGITRSGEKTRWGAVAVDPRVIPLHSRLVIEGWGETVFTALDTGGGVVGQWVDVWFRTDREALEHGTQELKVFLVED